MATGPQDLLRRAIRLAADNVRAGGGPFAALVVRDGKVIAEGVNQVTRDNDPTAHAEVVSIRRACAALARFDLRGCEIFASCEPCPMCLGAIYWARLDRIWFAATREDAAAADFDDSLLYEEIPLAVETRRVPAANLLREEALAPFQAWRNFAGRIPY